MEWIKVVDETPNYYVDVLMCDKHGYVIAGYLNKEGDWKMEDDLNVKDVLFWMPFPIAP